ADSEGAARLFACALRRLRFSRNAALRRRCRRSFSALLWPAFMGTILGSGERLRKSLAVMGARLRHFHTCGKDRRARSNRYFRNPRRCRSSVVEHALGKGEVVSSILTGSTRRSMTEPPCL